MNTYRGLDNEQHAIPEPSMDPPEPELETRDCPRCERPDAFMVDLEWGAGYCGACDYYGAVDIEEFDTHEGDDALQRVKEEGR